MLGLLPDSEIRRFASEKGMIEPFSERVEGSGIISYGLSSYGYDFRIADEFKIFTNTYPTIVDPKDLSKDAFLDFKGNVCVIPPNSFMLGRTVEYFRMPENVLGVCVGKSTMARAGLVMHCTPAEPMWFGYLTIEISNTTPLPAKIYANEGIGQMLFFASEPCEITYADRRGKYQGQHGITLPIVR